MPRQSRLLFGLPGMAGLSAPRDITAAVTEASPLLADMDDFGEFRHQYAEIDPHNPFAHGLVFAMFPGSGGGTWTYAPEHSMYQLKTGVMSGTVTRDAGQASPVNQRRHGYAWTFGGDGRFDYGNYTNVNWGTSGLFTVSFWFRSNSAATEVFVSKGDFNVTNAWNVLNVSGNLRLTLYNTVSGYTAWSGDGASSYMDGNWHQFIITMPQRDGTTSTDNCKFYANGRELGTTLAVSQGVANDDVDNSESLWIGARKLSGAQDSEYTGSLDQVYIWNRPFSAAEALHWWNSTKTSLRADDFLEQHSY